MDELLRLEQVGYRYDNDVVGIENVSLTLCAGERIAVLGNNGAGKSTFFLCCNGVLRPQQGTVYLKGQPITGDKRQLSQLRQTVGLVFQEPDSQIIAGTVESEVSFGPMNLRLGDDDVRTRVRHSLMRMNLSGYEKRPPHYLSGGEKKRVSIADILAMNPEMILLDEPTASLDPENTLLLEQTLEQMSLAGMTLVVSTHDVDFAYRFATRAVVFSRGAIIADAGIEDVFSSQEILTQAGLKKPLLYEVAQQLERRFPHRASAPKPKTIAQLQSYIDVL